AYETITGDATAWDNLTTTATADANNTPALTAISGATGTLNTWGASSGTASVNAADNASGVIGGAIGLLDAYDGRTVMAYVGTTYYSIGAPGGMFFGHGGVAGYADGGVVARMGEWGNELLHYPQGGIAITRGDGLYSVPRGTYVDTAPATQAKLSDMTGGITVNLTINGSVGVSDITEQVTRELVPAIQRAASLHRRSFA
nr:hypothetical protein [Gemmatimonadaceae bacterium]